MDEQILTLLQNMNAWINKIQEEVQWLKEWQQELASWQQELTWRIEQIESGENPEKEIQHVDVEPLTSTSIYEVMFSADRTSPWPNSTMNVMWNIHWRYRDRDEAWKVARELQSKWYQVSVSTITELW